MAARNDIFRAHSGVSMLPSLQPSDLLELEPFVFGKYPAPGDMIWFPSPHTGTPTVHRVVRLLDGHVVTRGDSNERDDPWEVPLNTIEGRVRAVWRSGTRKPIHPGIWEAGRIRGRVRLRGLFRILSAPLRYGYHLAAGSGLFYRLIPPRQRPKVVTFSEGSENRVCLIAGRQTVGRFDTVSQRWHIRAPYRLFVSPGALARSARDYGVSPEVPSDLPTHIRLLCECLGEYDDVRRRDLFANVSDTDFELFAREADRADVAALVYRRLNDARVSVPAQADSLLRISSLRNAARTAIITPQIAQVLTALAQARIDTIVLKGGHLAWTHYASPSLRSLGDIDLLVHRNHLAAAREIANHACAGHEGLPDFDLHHTIGIREFAPTAALEFLWSRAVPATIAEVQVLVLSPVDNLVYVCLHLCANHGLRMGAVKSLCDLTLVLQRDSRSIESSTLIDRAREWHALNSVRVSLLLAARLMRSVPATQLAASIDTAAGDTVPASIIRTAIDIISRQNYGPASGLSPEFWTGISASPLTNRLAAFARLLFASPNRLRGDFSRRGERSLAALFAQRIRARTGAYLNAFLAWRKNPSAFRESSNAERTAHAFREWVQTR